MMISSKAIASGLMLAGMLVLTSSPAAATGVETFTFTGTCSDCKGIATGVLTVVDTYVPGNSLSLSDFVSFTYYPTDLIAAGMSFTSENTTTVNGSIPGTLPGQSLFNIEGAGPGQFFTLADGHWYACPGGCGDDGPSYTWSAGSVTTPEPATIALTGLGWAALTVRRRRA